MINTIIDRLGRISAFFGFDILYSVASRLPRFQKLLLAKRLLVGEVDEFTFTRDNLTWTAFLMEGHITLNLMLLNSWQKQELIALIQLMERLGRLSKTTIIDVGANIGSSAILFALNTQCQILAIEPFPKTFQLLKRNVAQNALDNRIVCIETAVSAQKGVFKMAMRNQDVSSAEIVCPNSQAMYKSSETFDVETDMLINILHTHCIELDQIAFIKSDTEGHEVEVIESGQDVWRAGVPLFVEINCMSLEKHGGIKRFIELAARFFDSFIPSESLKKHGANAALQPISTLTAFIFSQINDCTDVLLLPQKA